MRSFCTLAKKSFHSLRSTVPLEMDEIINENRNEIRWSFWMEGDTTKVTHKTLSAFRFIWSPCTFFPCPFCWKLGGSFSGPATRARSRRGTARSASTFVLPFRNFLRSLRVQFRQKSGDRRLLCMPTIDCSKRAQKKKDRQENLHWRHPNTSSLNGFRKEFTSRSPGIFGTKKRLIKRND